MSGSYCGIRVGFYLLMIAGAVLFLVTQVMAAGSPSPSLRLEDCDWFRQPNQQGIETDTQILNRPTGDTPGQVGLGGGGAPTDRPSREDKQLWEMAVARGHCPARNAD